MRSVNLISESGVVNVMLSLMIVMSPPIVFCNVTVRTVV